MNSGNGVQSAPQDKYNASLHYPDLDIIGRLNVKVHYGTDPTNGIVQDGWVCRGSYF